MRTKRFFYNSISTAFYQIVVMIAGLITPRVMLKYYGSEINGLVSSINQFIIYFNLVEAGLSGAAIYALYKPLAEKNHKSINSIVSATKRFYNQSGLIFMSLVVGLAIAYPLYVRTESLDLLNVGFLVLILGSNGVLEFFTLAKYRVVLTADQRSYVISIASLVQIVVNTLIIILLGIAQVNITILHLVALLSIFARTLILQIYIQKNYPFLDFNEEPNYKALNKRWDALYLQILGAIQKGSPVVILTMITQNLKLVSVYTIFNMVIGATNRILSIFTSGLSASFGDVIAKGENKVLQKAYNEFEFVYYFLISFVYSISFVMIMPFIRLYTRGITDIDYDLPVIGFLFVLNGLLYNIKTPQGMLVISAGLFKETRIQSTIQGLIVVIAGIILVPFLGITGVLIGTILSNIYRDIDLLFFIPRRLTKLSAKSTGLRIIRMGLSIFIILLPFRIIDVNPSGYFSWALFAIGVGIYSLVVLIVCSFIFEKRTITDVWYRIIRVVTQ